MTEVVLPADPRDTGFAFARAVTERTRAIYIITPNNPDGRVLAEFELQAIAALARRHDLWVISDEVYADYVFVGQHRSIGTLDAMEDRTIRAYSASKSHALAGARVGWVLAPPAVVAAMRKLSTHTVFNVPVLMQRAVLAALGDDEWVASAREDYARARDAVAHALEGAGVAVSPIAGGVYHFLDFTDVLRGRPLKELLERAIACGVLLAPGEAFGAAHGNCARLCFTSAPLDRVLEGVTRLRRAVETF